MWPGCASGVRAFVFILGLVHVFLLILSPGRVSRALTSSCQGATTISSAADAVAICRCCDAYEYRSEEQLAL